MIGCHWYTNDSRNCYENRSCGYVEKIVLPGGCGGFLDGGKTQFRTRMVNGRPQIYFDAIGSLDRPALFFRD